MEDVVNEVATKMVRRHPHVFGDVEADTSEQVLKNWDEIKKKEKEGKEWIESPLREIPPELPSLTRAPKVLKKIDKLYEKGNDLLAVTKPCPEDHPAAWYCADNQCKCPTCGVPSFISDGDGDAKWNYHKCEEQTENND